MGVRLALALAATTLLAGCGPIQAAMDPPEDATVVLFDVSRSTDDLEIRERYITAFQDVVNVVETDGGHLAADVIDDNPLAHSTFTIKTKVDACGMFVNSLECKREAEEKLAGIVEIAREQYDAPEREGEDDTEGVEVAGERSPTVGTGKKGEAEPKTRPKIGTDILGALINASKFLHSVDDARDRRLVILSDMVQSGRGFHFGKIQWSAEMIEEMLDEIELPDLAGVSVYVVGAGATAPDSFTSDQIAGMEAFWGRLIGAAGGSLESYASTLLSFP